MKNTFIKIGLASLVLVSLAACGGGGGGSGKTKVVFKHRSSQANHALLETLAADYMKTHTNVEVTIEKYSGNYEQLLADNVSKLNTGDEYPDISECYPDHVERFFSFPGKVLDIKDKYDAFDQSEKDDFVEKFIEENTSYSIDGMYSMPFSKSTELMFYNEEKLIGLVLDGVNGGKKIDVEYLSNLTWEELFGTLCPAIKEYNEDNPDNKLYDDTDPNSCIFGYDSDDNLFITLCEQYGTGYTTVNQETGKGSLLWNNDNSKKFVNMLRDAKQAGYLQTSGTLGDYVNTLFTSNKCLFSVGSTAGYSYQCDGITFKIGVAQIPQAGDLIQGTTKKVATISQGPSVCFFNHGDSKRAAAAWDFYCEFAKVKNNAKWTTGSGYMAIKESVKETSEYQNYINTSDTAKKPNPSTDYCAAITMNKAQSLTNTLFYSPTFKGSSTSRSQVGGLVTAALKADTLTEAQLKKLFDDAENTTKVEMGQK